MKKVISALLLLVILISCISIGFTASAAEVGSNLITNSSFESNSGWGFGSLYRTTDKTHSGTYSIKSSARGVTVLVANGNTISVKQNTDYLFSGYIYRNDNSAWAYIDMNDATGELQLLNTESVGKWQYVVGVWNSGSQTSVTPRIVVEPNYTINQHMGAGITGDIWFDDISLCQLSYSYYNENGASLSVNAKGYSFKNADISVTVKSDGNKEYLTELTNIGTNHNWISGAQEVPLTYKHSKGIFNWILSGTSFADNTLTFTYKCNTSGITLNSVYKLYTTGPIYHYSEIINNSGKALEFTASDLVIADTNFTSPENITLYRFNRSRFNNSFDGNFTKGVFEDKVGTNAFFKTKTENSWLLSTGMLPFTLMQAEDEGLYMGYEWSYGEAILRTQNNAKKFKLSASLGISDDVITRENDESLLIPPVFFGAYEGDVDNGANQMKSWFYNNLMTASLRENANEPPIELHLPLFAENDLKGYLYDCDLEEWGVELTKMDYWWTVPSNSAFDAYLEQQWNPDSGKWPNGMTYGKLVKEAYPSVKTSLYMADTYQGVDIGTDEGRQKQLAALKQRLSNWQIDYWRSDFDILKPNNYENHEGLMYILDELTAWSDDFRYEHCSAGGSLKDFSTLRRMTFMTMEDSGGALNHRMAFYSNSYMINPVQLKFDMGFDWRPADSNEQNLINSNQQEWITYNVRTAMMGAMMIQNVSQRLNNQELEALKEGWSLYKDKQRPILKGADVYHILPMPTGSTLDGMQFYNNSIEEGSVFIFRDKGGETAKTIKLKGLIENATYKLTFEDRTSLNCLKQGKELMESGIYVSGLNSVYDSEIIWIEKISSDTPIIPTDPEETTTSPEPDTTPTATTPKPAETTPAESFATTSPSELKTEPSEDDTPIIIVPITTAIKVEPATTQTITQTASETTKASNSTAETSTSAFADTLTLGDTDLSGTVNIKDATLIQKFAANLTNLSDKAKIAADTDMNTKINIKDATAIQKFLANLSTEFPIGSIITI
ncbi:MAG: GH36 C-terminal domain-containing protein [Ruminococcus sp.]|nr:GH36 C-terminal domain-containing protein [Ruminococcus sp.]